jgi:CheY-specific phosphatase CheX
MFSERKAATETMQEMAGDACTELMAAYGLGLTRIDEPWTESENEVFSGVMGFVGDTVRGSCLLAAPETAVLAAAPHSAKARDWVGELANQLVGRVKTKLLAHGVTIALTTPVVLRGVRLSPLPRTHAKPRLFDSPAGRVLVWVEVEVTSAFELGSERLLRVCEGDLLVF